MFTKIEATDSFYNKVNVTINPLINVLGGYNSIKKEKGKGKIARCHTPLWPFQ